MAGESGNQQAVLRALRPDACLTVAELTLATRLPNKNVVKGAAALIMRGFAARAEVGCFTLTPEGEAFRASGAAITSGPKGPLTQAAARRPQRTTLRDRLWTAMRVAGKFSVPELLTYACTGEGLETDAKSNAQRYVRVLAHAGYLRELPRREAGTAPTSNGYKRWTLVRDTGPRTPVYQPGKRAVWDPNKQTAYPTDRAPAAGDGAP